MISVRLDHSNFADPLAPSNGRPQFNKNLLYINRSVTTFAETAWHSGVEAS